MVGSFHPSRQYFTAVWLVSAIGLTPLCQVMAAPKNISQTSERNVSGDVAAKLVSQMTLAEKVSQLDDEAPAIPRLGIPAYFWWSEGLHGVARSGYATVFPQAMGMAATWDEPLIHRAGDIVGTEFRSKYNGRVQPDGSSARYEGLTVWSPNINIVRDPRWGRGQETYGEDPYLTARTGIAFVQGLQGPDLDHPKTIATVKHFAVYSGPEYSRHSDDFHPTPHDLEDTYLPAFRATVTEGKAKSVMCSYPSVNGVPACANSVLLKTYLRKDWGFDGYVVSDCGAVTNIYDVKHHNYTANATEAASVAFKGGLDLICGWASGPADGSKNPIYLAAKSGLLSEDVIDRALIRLLKARMELGILGPPIKTGFGTIGPDQVDTVQHRDVSLQLARESMVLLKNKDNLLPIKGEPRTIAVIGPNADTLDAVVGNYHGDPSHPVTILEGLRARYPNSQIVHVTGSGLIDAAEMLTPTGVLCVDQACTQNGLKLEEFSGLEPESTPVDTQTIREGRFEWYQKEGFSLRWTGFIKVPESGDYMMRIDDTNGYRIKIGDDQTIDTWKDGYRLDDKGGMVRLEAGKTYPFVAEMKPHRAWGTLRLFWTPPGDQAQMAVAAASKADLVVVVAGLSARIEDEEMPIAVPGFDRGDRTSLDLPQVQENLIKQVVGTGKPVVLVLTNGSALSVNWADQHVPAIIEAWYPGGQGGTAVAGLIAGDYSPAGRLPLTFYKSVDQLPDFKDYAMKARTYRYFSGEPLYPFGYGLSYTRFDYSAPSLGHGVLQASHPQTVSVNVTNSGVMDGDEVVQLYVSHPKIAGAPIRALAGFQRVYLKQGETKTVRFTLDERALSVVDANGDRYVRPGIVNIWVGGGQPITLPNLIRAAGTEVEFRVRGVRKLAR